VWGWVFWGVEGVSSTKALANISFLFGALIFFSFRNPDLVFPKAGDVQGETGTSSIKIIQLNRGEKVSKGVIETRIFRGRESREKEGG